MVNKHGLGTKLKWGACLSLPALALLSGCSSSPTPHYYTLSPHVVPLQSSGIQSIEVLPVTLPDRLDRTSLVIQNRHGKSELLDNERWTSSLSSELRDGISAGLQQKLNAVDRYNSGMPAAQKSYRIAIDFANFDILESSNKLPYDKAGKSIYVMVNWIIKPDFPAGIKPALPDLQQLSCRTQFNINSHAVEPGINQAVAVSTQALNRVIENISTTLVELNAKQPVAVEGVSCN